jgi:hypothetical protein
MATATTLGPIGINQVNNVFYVGTNGGFPSIQAAVDYIQKYNAGVGEVIIVHGYTSTEEIGAVVRGSATTYISDQRDTQFQNWEWNGFNFVAAEFMQLSHGQFGGQLKAFGFIPPDFTSSNVSVGLSGDGQQKAIVSLINALAPIDERLWSISAHADSLVFLAAKDSGVDTYWMQAMRGTGNTVDKVIVYPPMDVQGELTSQGSPVRTFANSGGGGGGGGGVNPGNTGQLSFYQSAGPLVSPSQITTDASTQSTLNVPGLMQGKMATTNNVDEEDRSLANPSYVQEETISVTAGAGFNFSGQWSVTKHHYHTMYQGQRGICQMESGTLERHAIGDTAGLYFYVLSDGGTAAGSDEGVTGISAHVWELQGYFHGTIATTTGTGDMAPTYTLTGGANHLTDGAFLLNISKGQLNGNWNGASTPTYMDIGAGAVETYLNQLPITNLVVTAAAWSATTTYAAGNIVTSGGNNYVSLVPGNANHAPATSAAQWAVLPAGQLPLSTAAGITTTTGIPFSNQPANTPVSQSLVVNLAKIGGTFPPFAAGDVVTIAGPNYPEQSILTTASAPVAVGSGMQQTLTMKLRNPQFDHPSIIFKGGIQGQYISMDANLAFSGMRSSYFAFASLDGVNLIYGYQAAGSMAGRILPQSTPAVAAEAATSTGANSGFHLCPGAEVTSLVTFANLNATLEQNGVRWQAGDAVECPHFPAFGGSGFLLDRYQISPTPLGGGSIGLDLELSGPGFCGGAQAILIRCGNSATNYYAAGGPVTPPGGIQMSGFYSYGLAMSNAPPQPNAVLSVASPASPSYLSDGSANPGANPNAKVTVLSILQGNITFDPGATTAGTWDLTGAVQIGGSVVIQNGGLTVGYGATFLTTLQGSGVQITGDNTTKALIFDTSAGGTQGITCCDGGYPVITDMYYDTVDNWMQAGFHRFRVSGTEILTLGSTAGVGITGPITVNGHAGVSGTITSANTVTVVNGLITAIA